MAYTIKNADGTVLVNLVDGTLDTRTTSISLIGKNQDAYGTAWNTNLVNMLQNFASNSQPRAPLVGQLWFSKADGKMKVYGLDGVFRDVSAASMSDGVPLLLKPGDLWIDTDDDQLYFSKDGDAVVLAGPVYSSKNGKSGFLSEYLIDDVGNTRSVTTMYSNGVLLGVLSTCSFIVAPASSIAQDNQGMFSIEPGLNLNYSIADLKFVGIATTASNVGEEFTLTNIFLKLDNGGTPQDLVGTGALNIASDAGVSIGTYTDLTLLAGGNISARRAIIRNNVADSVVEIQTKSTIASPSERTVLTAYRNTVGINLGAGNTPIQNFHVEGNSYFNGNATITGNLTVQGTSTYVSTEILQIRDKNIELATSSTWYTDSLVDGGGITLHGTTDKTIVYDNSSTSWKSNINFNIAGTGTYKINNIEVVTPIGLGNNVTQTSITRVGVLNELTVTNVIVKGNGLMNKTGSYSLTSAISSGTSTGSAITVTLSEVVPIINVGSTVVVDGLSTTEFNSIYVISTVTSLTTVTQFVVIAQGALSTTTAALGATPAVYFNDLMLSAAPGYNISGLTVPTGGIDVTGKRLKNLPFSSVPSDAATVEYANLVAGTQATKGIAITIDETRMVDPKIEIATLLNKLMPPANSITPPNYPSDNLYDLPEDYRARVLCQTNSVLIKNLPINVVSTSTTVLSDPSGAPVNVLQYISITSGQLTTSTSLTYNIREFRIFGPSSGRPAKIWEWYRDIP
jgi:hypothetical protein